MKEEIKSSKPRVLAIGGSIRSTGKIDQKVLEIVNAASSIDNVLHQFRQMDPRILSNSEILAGISLYGAKEEKTEIDFFSLRRLFKIDVDPHLQSEENIDLDKEAFYLDSTKIDQAHLNDLLQRIRKADTLILSTPVYFGDRSSVVDTLLKILHDQNSLQGKGFSVVSVGAKRNGGQETTNIYALFDAINMGALALGNGPKTSQYGGTAFAGDRGATLNDEFGIETALGTGRRSAQLAKILCRSHSLPSELKKAVIGVLITADNHKKEIELQVQNYLHQIDNKLVDFKTVNLIDYHIERCLGCKICPSPEMVEKGSKGKTEVGSTDYACLIDNGVDCMEVVREKLKEIDGLIIVGINDDSLTDLIDKYQVFTERTRFIRRGNFEWTNNPFTSLVLKNVGSTRERLFGLRAMTSYIRHNTIAVAPLRALTYQKDTILSPISALQNFTKLVAQLKYGREKAGPVQVNYIASGTGGYEHTELDNISALRK